MLKRLITLAVVAIAATNVQAQNTYQANQFRLDSCQIVGKRAANAWKYREAGQPYPANVLTNTDPIDVLHLFAVNYAMHDASSMEDAIKVAFVKCMDNIDKVYRYGRQGKLLGLEDLN